MRDALICSLLLLTAAACGDSTLDGTSHTAANQACGLTLEVSGATFAPTHCELEVVSGGEESPTPSPGDNVLVLRDYTPGHLYEAVVFHIASLAAGTYALDAAQGKNELGGQAIDERSIARALLSGSVTLGAAAELTPVSFELSFANGIELAGHGALPLLYLAAP